MLARSLAAILVVLFSAFVPALVSAQAPEIESITPDQLPLQDGDIVIVGNYLEGASVELEGKPITPNTITDHEIQLTVAPSDNGYALIGIKTEAGSAHGEILYLPPRLEDLPAGYITTVVGIGFRPPYYRPATSVNIPPHGLAVEKTTGLLYFASGNAIVRINDTGLLEPFAGTGQGAVGSLDVGDGGPATEAQITFCRSVVFDGADNAYIPDENHRIRRVDGNTGIITTVAGTGEAGFSGDGGPATAAQVDHPSWAAVAEDGTPLEEVRIGRVIGIALDLTGNILLSDQDISLLRRLNLENGRIETVAGAGPELFEVPRPAIAVAINHWEGDVAILPSGDLLYADNGLLRVFRVDQHGMV